VEKLRGIGPKTEVWLEQIGVTSYDDLDRLGSVAVYRLLVEAGYRPTLNALYALETALLDCHWRDLPESRKAELRAQLG
jgi:hypothetical protein